MAQQIEDIEEDLIDRAIRAYCTRERRAGRVVQQPSVLDSYTDNLDTNRAHAVLRNVNGVLAVYRVKDDGHIEFVAPGYWPECLYLTEDEPIDYARIRLVHHIGGKLQECGADVREHVLATLIPVPGKGAVAFGQMRAEDHEAVIRYLKSHDGMYPGERSAA
jgi:hypothetical protein